MFSSAGAAPSRLTALFRGELLGVMETVLFECSPLDAVDIGGWMD